MYLETLAGYIFDDDKLVTYKWLSKELGLHVNLSKQILWKFWSEHNKRKEVEATFSLIGYLEDGIMRVEVVKEENLSTAKKKFVKLTSEHLYSLQRALPDIELLALSGAGDHRQAAIICNEIVPRKYEELSELRWGSKVSGNVKETAGVINSADKSSKQTLTDQKSKKPINNIFGRVNVREKVKNPQEIAAAGTVIRGKKRQGPEDRKEKMKIKKQKLGVDADSRSSEESSVDENDDADQPDEAAPRKIVVHQSPPKYKIENGKKKVRKIIDKTSMDSDGYFVTRKEYVYESCSDNENQVTETPKNIVVVKKPPQQTSSSVVSKTNRNNKQASLLNFFKKS